VAYRAARKPNTHNQLTKKMKAEQARFAGAAAGSSGINLSPLDRAAQMSGILMEIPNVNRSVVGANSETTGRKPIWFSACCARLAV
jgi:hypothetical protein